MKHFFDNTEGVTLKLQNDIIMNEIENKVFDFSQQFQAKVDEGLIVEISQSSYELLTTSLQQFYKDVNEFAEKHPLRLIANEELKNYGI